GVEFDALPSAALLELYTDVGEILTRRGLTPEGWNPPQDYAETLAKEAFALTPETERGLMRDAQGRLVRVFGVRMAGLEETPLLPRNGLGEAESVVVILFERDYQLSEAAIAPASLIAEKASIGAVPLGEAFFGAQGVQRVSSRLHRFTAEDFE
ncbi:MAG: hypothetical protein AAGM38_02450, partial [Pseudomonadota bacterium]